ncbi:uncharacterized protein STEHIDRAFT_158063 [Stereum hirsutum FP-91666 SS1]|uniref:uncharacterized protein n=1 Tax=Stereum hirsutum (strain FP-91666) TaxID=721885 RepID=UPI0004449322|nr:uncharacterized protein STEHIDRAFT_158063 [Stereum hirsutum FP-91666 SS1]EIM85426.1 hypothetical protein STEHIDRAFT_158063 [Stereum hirsutum FP-91666 SS1]
MPLHRTEIRPLATCAKDEKQLAELKDTIRDVLKQLGQTKDSYQRRKIFIGDGLTFELILRLIDYLQLQENEFDRLDLVEPFLEQWHTAWTNLSRIFETFWGDKDLKTPSSLGHNASKIGVKPPSNLSKVDYYSGRHTAYLVLDARMMDCVRVYFETADVFQYFGDLGKAAKLLSLGAYHNAMLANTGHPSLKIPDGQLWTLPVWLLEKRKKEAEEEEMRRLIEKEKSKSKHGGKQPGEKPKDTPPPFLGDTALAESKRFMTDTILSRVCEVQIIEHSKNDLSGPISPGKIAKISGKFPLSRRNTPDRVVSEAVAAGLVGTVWEIEKYWGILFWGTSHHKYATYLLEMIIKLELKYPPRLKQWFLENLLINPSGEPGHVQEGDLKLEHINKPLEKSIHHKNERWDGPFLQEVESPNVLALEDIKKAS